MEKDFEEIMHTMGLNLSRAQIQKLAKKYTSRDRINYRYLTDSWANKDGTVTYKPGMIDDPPTTEQLLKGIVPKGEPMDEEPEVTDASEVAKTEGYVMYAGSLMNISHVMEQVAKMEADRNAALQKNSVDDTVQMKTAIQEFRRM
ncbi:unnamed protein product, partial [Gongylonema pulchrum]|uniref:Phage protein n=1 Tax=Gongylonema pulchrum TaxID=637853 RepID=A0A183DCN7_9BILA